MTPELWLVPLAAPAEHEARLRAQLDESERERLERFAFPWLRTRFVVAHAALRWVAARHLHVPPASLRFATGRYGKPYLPGCGLELSLSHTAHWAMVAVGHQPLGVDIEAVEPARAGPSMIRMVSSVAERAAFATMPAHAHALAFFRLWVRKEAVLKALGTGLSRPLDTIDVPLAAAAPPDGVVLRPLAAGESVQAPAPGVRWWLWDVPAPPDHLAALVVGQPEHEPPRPPGPVGRLTLADLDP